MIDVVAWPAKYSDRADSGDINVGLISGHDYHHFKSWRGKLERIGEVLKGESYPALFFYFREDLDAFIAPLQEAAEVAFPRKAS